MRMMASEGNGVAPPVSSSVYSSLFTSALGPQTSLNSALENAVEADRSNGSDAEEDEDRQVIWESSLGVSRSQEAGGCISPKNSNNNVLEKGQYGNNASKEPEEIEVESVNKRRSSLSSGLKPCIELSNPPSEGDVRANGFDYDVALAPQQFEASELELIEEALENFHEPSGRNFENDGGQESVDELRHEREMIDRSFASSHHLQDLNPVARLLEKVQAVRAHERDVVMKRESSKSEHINSRPCQQAVGEEQIGPADIRQVVQAASKAALAAAKAAQEVVGSVNRNSLALEKLCKTLTHSSSLQISANAAVEGMEKVDQSPGVVKEELHKPEIREIELQQTEIAKGLVRQNTITHWVLGLMIASTFIWRYGVVKFVQRVHNTVQNPLQGITGMFDGLKHPEDGHRKASHKLPQLKLPSILQGEECEVGESNGHHHAEQEESHFNIGSLLPGIERDTGR